MGEGGGNRPTTLTPKVMFIEKKKKKETHTDPGRTQGEVVGEGDLGAPRGPDITSVNEAAGAGHRAACPLAPLPFIR